MSVIKSIFGKKPTIPAYSPVDVDQTLRDAISSSQASLGPAQQLASGVNLFNTDQVRSISQRLLPGLLDQSSELVGAQLRGELTPQMQRMARNDAAAASLGLGLGGTGFQANQEATGMLLARLNQQQQGLQNFQGLQQTLAPRQFDVSAMFLSPEQRLGVALQQNQDQFNYNYLQAKTDAAPAPWGTFTQDIVKSL